MSTTLMQRTGAAGIVSVRPKDAGVRLRPLIGTTLCGGGRSYVETPAVQPRGGGIAGAVRGNRGAVCSQLLAI